MEGKANGILKWKGEGGDGFTPAICLIKMGVGADMTFIRIFLGRVLGGFIPAL